MRYATFKEFAQAGLAGTPQEGAPFEPGPDLPNIPGRFVVLTRFGGPGLNTEDLFDGVGYQVRAVGEQVNYQDAEDLALAIDLWFLRKGFSQRVGGKWMTSIQRLGSPPTPLLVDDAERHHFVCSYVVDIESGL